MIVNRQIPGLTGREIFKELNISCCDAAETIPIHFGGPVHPNELFVLHGPPFTWSGCLEVVPFMGLSNTIDILEAAASGKGPNSCMIALGCAGWGPGQLEDEVKQNSWVTCPVVEEILYSRYNDMKWAKAMAAAGVDPALLSDTAGHA